MRINELFQSVQGEGKYTGTPSIFIRLSGCNLNCSWCDTKYHTEGEDMNVAKIYDLIKQFDCKTIVWTGGEPMLQVEDIQIIMEHLSNDYEHHLETNGTISTPLLNLFNYIAFSPKNKKGMETVLESIDMFGLENYDVKVVTDGKVNKDLIKDSTMLMPLTIFDKEKDLDIKRKVWAMCINYNKKYCPRLHVDLWGGQRGV